MKLKRPQDATKVPIGPSPLFKPDIPEPGRRIKLKFLLPFFDVKPLTKATTKHQTSKTKDPRGHPERLSADKTKARTISTIKV